MYNCKQYALINSNHIITYIFYMIIYFWKTVIYNWNFNLLWYGLCTPALTNMCIPNTTLYDVTNYQHRDVKTRVAYIAWRGGIHLATVYEVNSRLTNKWYRFYNSLKLQEVSLNEYTISPQLMAHLISDTKLSSCLDKREDGDGPVRFYPLSVVKWMRRSTLNKALVFALSMS